MLEPAASSPSRRSQAAVIGSNLLSVGDRAVPLVFEKNERARRIIIRLDHGGSIVVVLPARATKEDGRRFALSNRGWIRERLAHLPEPLPFLHGVSIPYLGIAHRIRHRQMKRGFVWREAGEIHVAGRPEHLPRRVEDWLKQEARREIERRALQKAEELGKRVRRIGIRDPRSRWGSCSPDGTLNFSWRLILAPRFVVDYVVAHEVAHLRELNHGSRFWRLTEALCADTERARAWLAENGPGLHRYGKLA
ncbi:MAG TPA: SprT family zinc-dependent metalloprotease [Dongiaceae bacterium]|nr:SprT family zinc-dependent metalloprotease [Dongiaceae bacterium]